MTRWRAAAVWLILLCAVGLEVYGFRAGHLFSQHIWDEVGLVRFARYSGAYLVFAAFLMLRVPRAFPLAVAAIVMLLTAIAVGPAAVLATAFFLVSMCALGMRLLGRGTEDSAVTHLLATLLGAAVCIFSMTLLARLPVHYPAVWGVLIALPVAAGWRGVGRRLAYWWRLLRSRELEGWGEHAALALMVFLLVMHWLVVLEPEKSADGLAMHLAIATNISAHHAFTLEPGLYVWSVMPMGADWTYSIVYLLGGEPAARLLNFAMLLVVAGLLYCAVRRWVDPSAGFLLVALFLTTPLVQLVTGSLFVENTLAAMILGMMTAIWKFGSSGERKFLYLAMALAGTALAVKLAGLSFVGVALVFVALEARRHWKVLGSRPAMSCLLAMLLFLSAVAPTYAIAWQKTGNPVFPFLNEKIHSPLIDPSVQFQDNEFRRQLSWRTPFELTFHTSLYYEGQEGSFGFQYLLLAPLGLLAVVILKRGPAVAAAVVSLGASFLVLRSEPNARFIYAALPLLSVPFAALLGRLGKRRYLYVALVSYAVACTLLNTYFVPASSYYHKDFCMQSPLSRTARDRYIREYDPIRQVVEYFNRAHPNAAVLLAADNDLADTRGEVFENSWHQYAIVHQLQTAAGVQGVLRLVEKWKVHYFIGRKPTPAEPVEPAALGKLLEFCTVPEYDLGLFRLSHLDTTVNPSVCTVSGNITLK